MTQVGIAAGVNINYSHVPRAVKRLQEQGLLIEKTVHILAHPTGRRRKAYFLTAQGITVAKDLFTMLAEYPMVFRDKKGNTSKIPLRDINKYLKTKEDLFTLYKFLNSDNIFDLMAWEKIKKKIKDKSLIKTESGRLSLKEVKKLLGPGFNAEEANAIFHHTDGNPRLIKIISEIEKSAPKELNELSAEERALTLYLMARSKLEKLTTNSEK